MTVAASSILNRVRTQLVDDGLSGAPQRWTDTELLRWLSDGQRTIVAAIPRAASKIAVVTLTAGTRQTLPSDGHILISVVRNMGTTGTSPGNAVQNIPKVLMDVQYPTWHADTAATAITAWVYDLSDQLSWLCYPPSNGTGKVEINYAVMPADLTATTDTLTVKDIYQTALVDYVLARAHQKDSDYAAGEQRAAGYLSAFTAFLSSMNSDGSTNATMAGKT